MKYSRHFYFRLLFRCYHSYRICSWIYFASIFVDAFQTSIVVNGSEQRNGIAFDNQIEYYDVFFTLTISQFSWKATPTAAPTFSQFWLEIFHTECEGHARIFSKVSGANSAEISLDVQTSWSNVDEKCHTKRSQIINWQNKNATHHLLIYINYLKLEMSLTCERLGAITCGKYVKNIEISLNFAQKDIHS